MLNIESNYNLPENTEIVFEAIPGTSQELALDSRADHTLLVGTRGSGKTAIQLMRFRKYVGLGYGKYLTGIIFDKEFKNLGDLEAQSRIFFPQFEDGCRFLSSVSDYMWIWPTGERLLFRHVKKLADYEGFHGWNVPYLGWNEITKWYDSDLYDKFMSINRNSFVPEKHTPTVMVNGKKVYNTPDRKPLPPLPNQVFSTTNTIGPGRSWVKKRFVDPAPYGKPIKTSYKVFSAKDKKEIEVVKSQVCIFSSYTENPYLSIDYIASLQELTKNNENLRKSWLEGSWDVTSGGALDDLWDTNIHVLDRFPVPANWRVDRSLDWGSSAPYAVIWWAEADGTEVVLPEGVLVHGQKTFCPEKGSLIAIAELYGTKEIGTNKGLIRSASDVADDIVGMERSMLQSDWIQQKPMAGPADNSIGRNEDKKLDTIEKLFSDKGVRWIKFNKPSGSREIGLQMFRDRLECALKGEGKAIYFMRNCKAGIETVPTLPRDEKNQDDVDDNAEAHWYDSARYRILTGGRRFVGNIKVTYPNSR